MDTKAKPIRKPRRAAPPARAVATRHRGPSLSEMITLQWESERGDLDLREFLLAIYFMRLGTIVDGAFDRMCRRRYKVSGGDMRVLLALRRSGPPYVRRPTDLFRALLVTSGAITKKVDRLVEAGLAERLPDPGHNGGFLIHLTKRGLQFVEETVESLARESSLAPAMDQFSDAERDDINRYALRILSALEQARVHGDDVDVDE